MTDAPDRPVGDVYDPAGDASGRLSEQGAGDGGKEQAPDAWPASAYDPGETAEAVSAEPDPFAPRPESGDPSLARLLLDHLGEGGSAELPEQGPVLPLEAPDLRNRVLDRLERVLEASEPDLLVASGPGAIDVGAPLADRAGLPLLREEAVRGDAGRWPGTRVALVGTVLRPAAIAGVLRAVEARGATVVAIVGLATRDGEDSQLMSQHYNLFAFIHL